MKDHPRYYLPEPKSLPVLLLKQVRRSFHPVLPIRADPSQGRTKEGLTLAWDGFTLLTKKIESCLGGTVAKAPIAAFNALVEIGTVCHVDAFNDFYK